MSSGTRIEAPHTLASLPRPLDAKRGRRVVSTVHSLSGLKKRKRPEVVVSADGEGINIYNVRSPRLLASYALPPQSYLSCPPCSIYQKSNDRRPARRYTYAPISNSRKNDKSEIWCFEESSTPNDVKGPTKYTYLMPSGASTVCWIDIVPLAATESSSDRAHCVLIVTSDGVVRCLSSDLKSTDWSTSLYDISSHKQPAGEISKTEIEYVAVTDAESAARGIFKAREDIVAALGVSATSRSEILQATHILSVVVSSATPSASNGSLSASFYVIRPQSSEISSRLPPIQFLATWPLADPEASGGIRPDERSKYSLHASNGLLHRLVSGSITTYDFTGTLPRIRSTLSIPGLSFHSFIRLSPSLIMTTTSEGFGVYDIIFNSLRAAFQSKSDPSLLSPSRKRKWLDDENTDTSLRLIQYFSDSRLAVGISDDELIGIHVGDGSVITGRGKAGESLLIDSIGKGIKQPSRSRRLIPTSFEDTLKLRKIGPDQNWRARAAELDSLVESRNVAAFEAHFLSGVPVGRRKIICNLLPQNAVNGIKKESDSGHNSGADQQEVQIDSREAPHALAERFLSPIWDELPPFEENYLLENRHKAVYALGKIFAWAEGKHESQSSPFLTIQFFPPNVFQWLIHAGYLTPEMVQQGLRQYSSPNTYSRDVGPDEFVTAIMRHDPEMRLLYRVFDSNLFLDVPAIVHAMKFHIQSLDNNNLPEPSRNLLANDVEAKDSETVSKQLDLEVQAATSDIDHALALLEDGPAIRGSTLRLALTRLYSFPTPSIVQALRATLNRAELTFLIQILRIELRDGGWITKYVDSNVAQVEDAEDPSDHAILIITKLLSCALDAIGASGWLSAGDSNSISSTDELLHSLRREVAATLEGVHEATFMQGILGHFLKYSLQKTRTEERPSYSKKLKPVTVAPLVPKDEDRILPLNLKVEGEIGETKLTSGGEIKRMSVREIGMEISKRVGKYSFERIRV